MNVNAPIFKEINNEALLGNNAKNVVPTRKKANPLGDFWLKNLEDIFAEF